MMNKFLNEFSQVFMISIGSAFSIGILLYIINDSHSQQLKNLHRSYKEDIKILKNKVNKLEQQYGVVSYNPNLTTDQMK